MDEGSGKEEGVWWRTRGMKEERGEKGKERNGSHGVRANEGRERGGVQENESG